MGPWEWAALAVACGFGVLLPTVHRHRWAAWAEVHRVQYSDTRRIAIGYLRRCRTCGDVQSKTTSVVFE